MQFCFLSIWAALYSYTGDVFPTRARSTGSGLAATLGRIGSMLSPLVIPLAMARYGITGVFVLAAILPIMLGVAAVLILGPETIGRVLEEVSG